MTRISETWRRIRWELHLRRCICGHYRIPPGTSMELRGVKHRTEGSCFMCDVYGNPV